MALAKLLKLIEDGTSFRIRPETLNGLKELVITSYSIHYTKLYEYIMMFGFTEMKALTIAGVEVWYAEMRLE